MSNTIKWHSIIGHEQSLRIFIRMLQTENIQHAMLLTGPEGVGKSMIARVLAAGILCDNRHSGEACGECASCRQLARGSHPDLIIINPEGQNIKIDQVRAMQHEMSLGPCLSQYRICIIENAEYMTDQAANSLLKLLEEPPAYLVFILTVSQRYRLLTTIVSRCRLYPFYAIASEQIAEALKNKGIIPGQAVAAARLSGGRIGSALRLAEVGGFDIRDQAFSILERLPSAGMQSVWDTAASLNELDDKEILEIFRFLEYLARDLLVLKTAMQEKIIYNIDIIDQLRSFSNGWTEAALTETFKELRQAERAIVGNANTRLTVEALLINLMDLYKGGKPLANSSRRPV